MVVVIVIMRLHYALSLNYYGVSKGHVGAMWHRPWRGNGDGEAPQKPRRRRGTCEISGAAMVAPPTT
jgi:hypothetical protein